MGERWDRFMRSRGAVLAGGALGLSVAMGGVALHAVGHAMHGAHGAHAGDPHTHADVPPPRTYQEAVVRLRALVAKMEASLATGTIAPDLHEDAHQADSLGRALGRLAMRADSGVASKDIKGINLAGKDLAKAAGDLHDAADANKPVPELRTMLASVKAAAARLGVAADSEWVCEMHCEGEKLYTAAGACPVCGMGLTRVSETPWGVVITSPGPVAAGKPADLAVRLTDPRGRTAKSLETVHEHPLHLVVVSQDLSKFWHEHPEPIAGRPGEFTLKGFTFPAPGRYVAYGDFTPTGGASVMGAGNRQPRTEFKIAGEPPPPVKLVEDFDSINRVDGYEVRVRCNGDKFFAGRDTFLRYGLDQGGKPVTDLQPLMGELGHVVAISEDLQTYLHSHPLDMSGKEPASDAHGHSHGHAHGDAAVVARAREAMLSNGSPSDVVFHLVFPRPGIYRVFSQFKHAGKVITSAVTVDALPSGTAGGAAPTPGHDHDHAAPKAGGESGEKR